MGDRGQIKINDVYLYTHWYGSNLKKILASALNRGRSRWEDPEYLARIIFCEMVKGEEMDDEGFGIGPELHGDVGILLTIQENTITYQEIFNDVSKIYSSFQEFLQENFQR